MSTVIAVEGLSKKYLIRHQPRERYTALRDVLADGARAAARRLLHPHRANPRAQAEEFWALRDVSFDIRQGERVGIIGRNGAGKSTLLKVLSRITEPTAGRVKIRGRVASLLEVGTGFHPELTGRENIFLNGAILGMGRAEIRRKFDDIVAFAEVERFLDTPVKRYSSGMYVRLAFAVAAHLEPEVLIVDEVLAVGDAQFQKKCLGRMQDIGKEGRTVLFVSHNMNAVEQLCTEAMCLDAGRLMERSDDVRQVITNYVRAHGADDTAAEWINPGRDFADPRFTPKRLALTDRSGQALATPIRNDTEAWIWIEGDIETLDPALQLGYGIFDEGGTLLYWTCHTDAPQSQWVQLRAGHNVLRSRLPRRLLNEGVYRIEVLGALYCREWIAQPGVHSPHITIEIRGGLSDSPYWMVRRPGKLAPALDWIGP